MVKLNDRYAFPTELDLDAGGGKNEYARDDGTPTWEALEEIVGGLESGQAVAFASGAASSVVAASSTADSAASASAAADAFLATCQAA